MLRMMKMELTVFKKYLKQLVFTLMFVVTCLAIGMGSLGSVPGTAFLLIMFNMTMIGAGYDEQNDWGVFRLVLPVSRRDVVLGRYAFNIVVASCAAMIAMVFVAVLTLLGMAVPLPEFFAKIVTWGEGELEGMVAALISCVCISLAISSVTLPAYFKLGQTKATQWLPFVMLGIGVAPALILAMDGGPLLNQLQGIAAFAETDGGLAIIAAVALGVALAAYAASAFISIKLYEARDL